MKLLQPTSEGHLLRIVLFRQSSAVNHALYLTFQLLAEISVHELGELEEDLAFSGPFN